MSDSEGFFVVEYKPSTGEAVITPVAETTENDARVERLIADFREWFDVAALPSDANRDQFDRWITDLLNAARREAEK